jgi:hypothetical protein
MLACRTARKYRRQTAWAATRLVALTLLLLFASATVFAQTVPPGQVQGVLGEYWENIDLTGAPSLRRTDLEINFDWGGGGPFAAPSPVVDGFSARWSGTITAPLDGDYTFHLGSDDGMRLWLNFQPLLPSADASGAIVDTWVRRSYVTTALTPVKMMAGVPVPFKVEFYESVGAARATLEWSARDSLTGRSLFPQQIVPFTALRSLNSSLPTFQCLPYEIGGSGGPFYVVSNADGRAIWWRCGSMVRTVATLGDYMPPITCSSPIKEFQNALASVVSGDYLAAFTVALQKCVTPTPIGSPDYVKLNALFDLASADAKRVYPPPVLWVVAKNSTLPTRPAYNISATGSLVPSAVRAPVDVACDCKKPLVKGTSTYCVFVKGPTGPVEYSVAEVALCVKK